MHSFACTIVILFTIMNSQYYSIVLLSALDVYF